MKVSRASSKCLSGILSILLLLTLVAPQLALAAGDQQVVYAGTAAELQQAVKSNTKIVLEGKNYIFDRTISIENIENLTIEGNAATKILTSSSMIEVIQIVSSNGITLKGFTAGHEQKGDCDAGVLSINNSSVTVDACDLFGCGTDGITIIDSSIAVSKTTIRDCSRNIVNSFDSQATFEDCTFSGNGYIKSPENAIGVKSIRGETETSTLTFSNCKFLNNKNSSLVNESANVTFTDCTFTGNSWLNGPSSANDSGTLGTNITWVLKDGNMVISGAGEMPEVTWDGGDTRWGGNSQRIKTITIEKGITSIYNTSFSSCNNLESVTIGESVTKIDFNAFSSCVKLNSVYIPASVKFIGGNAFGGCRNLADVYYAGSEADWNKITIVRSDYDDTFGNTTIHYNSTSSAPAVPTVGGFTDVKADSYYAEPVLWAVKNMITTGTSTTRFSPSDLCTKAQILSFLWRANGTPMPQIANPFTDIIQTDYYYFAALWAYENGLVSGSLLNGGEKCTRSMAVEYIWKAAGSPVSNKTVSFTDIPAGANYAQAVAWAVEKGITSGTGATTFSPSEICTRAQIMTFLYRVHND